MEKRVFTYGTSVPVELFHDIYRMWCLLFFLIDACSLLYRKGFLSYRSIPRWRPRCGLNSCKFCMRCNILDRGESCYNPAGKLYIWFYKQPFSFFFSSSFFLLHPSSRGGRQVLGSLTIHESLVQLLFASITNKLRLRLFELFNCANEIWVNRNIPLGWHFEEFRV